MAAEVTGDGTGVTCSFHQFQSLERLGRGRRGNSELHAGALRACREGEIAVRLSGVLARHHRYHDDGGDAAVGGRVCNLVFSGSASGPPEGHAVYGSTVTVITLPTASFEILNHKRAHLADTHCG